MNQWQFQNDPMFTPQQWREIVSPLDVLHDCTQCPRECHVDRTKGRTGYCQSGDEFAVGSICAHRGEEPVISGKHGICNIFFMHCNLQCTFCQNWQISRTQAPLTETIMSPSEIIRAIESILEQGARGIGFVSPSHYIPQMKTIIKALKTRGHNQPFIYNSNGYDKAEIIRSLENTIQVYLPDLKYMDDELAKRCSDAPNYVEYATSAIKEMYRQKGANIYLDDDGYIQFGLIIRHLVIPGQIENSKMVLRFIAEELSPDIHVSLMSQYHPTGDVKGIEDLGRTLKSDEYDEVLDEFDHLGFHRGWVQELASSRTYRPDFDKDHPFE
jgi:putative pyruvate formate lyase activating enzyme